jgi:hypothetical protein
MTSLPPGVGIFVIHSWLSLVKSPQAEACTNESDDDFKSPAELGRGRSLLPPPFSLVASCHYPGACRHSTGGRLCISNKQSNPN